MYIHFIFHACTSVLITGVMKASYLLSYVLGENANTNNTQDVMDFVIKLLRIPLIICYFHTITAWFDCFELKQRKTSKF